MPQQLLIHARGAALDAAHGDIQIMPPGVHEITPSDADGKPISLKVTITSATAEALEAARASYQAAADAGNGDAPFIDFNHADGPAAAWVKEIFWAGDAPDQGVRARIEWTDAGREAIEGRAFRRFSPAFTVDAKSHEITGAPVNMGGLVNRAAFRTIQSFFAANSQPSTLNHQLPMTPEEITALQSENETLRAQIAELQTQLDAFAQKDAEDQVEAAAKDGRIAPAKEVKAKWVAAILKDKAASELLAGMAPNAIFTTDPVTKATGTAPDRDTLRAQLAELPRSERPAFFAKHKETLISK